MSIRDTEGDIQWADVVIHHVGYQDPTRRGPKLERDLRLLQMEHADHPDDPFTLFNLGWTYHETGRFADALPFLQASLSRSAPQDSIVRKLFALLLQCQLALGHDQEALAVCRDGRKYYPDDVELLFEEGVLLLKQSQLASAEACFVQLLEQKPDPHFSSVDAGLRGYKARHYLGALCRLQQRSTEAVVHWQKALQERPDFVPALMGLGELYLDGRQWSALEEVGDRLCSLPSGRLEGEVIMARAKLARREFRDALAQLDSTCQRFPEMVWPRVVRSHVLLQEGRDLDAAERALQEVLRLEPGTNRPGTIFPSCKKATKTRATFVSITSSDSNHGSRRYAFGSTSLIGENGVLLQHRTALGLVQQGRAAEAGDLLRGVLEQNPHAVNIRNDYAVILASQGRLPDAIAQFQQVVDAKPDFVDAWGNLGKLLLQNRRVDEAVSALERFVAGKPGLADGFVHLGYAYRQKGRPDDSLRCLQQAVALEPNLAEAHLQLGIAQARMMKPTDALASVREAVRLKPDYIDALHQLGVVFREWASSTRRSHTSRSPGAQGQLGQHAGTPRHRVHGEKDYAQAQKCFHDAVRLQPHSYEACNNLGNALLHEGKLDESVASFQKAIQLKPDYAEAYSNLGIALGKSGDLQQAIAFFNQALRWKPNQPAVHLNLALHCLAAGDFERGWHEYEWRWRTNKLPARQFEQPAWDGSPLDGRTILLFAEQGLGDTFQFIRYAAIAKRRGGKTIVEAPTALLKILSRCPGIDGLVSQGSMLPPLTCNVRS